ncbi:MAG: hypothetical protein ABUL61_02260, partial [Oleiharenicola lentus]
MWTIIADALRTEIGGFGGLQGAGGAEVGLERLLPRGGVRLLEGVGAQRAHQFLVGLDGAGQER